MGAAMRRRLIAALIALSCLAATGAAAQEAEPFRILNRTGQEATALHAVRSPRGAQGDWGPNLLRPDRPLGAEAGFRVRPGPGTGCRFDLRLVLADGRESILRDRDICAEPEVTMAATIARPTAPAVAEQRPNPRARAVSTGSGFLVGPERVLTNQHVVNGCNRVVLRAPDGRWLGAVPPARVDAELDLALLSVPGLEGPALAFRSAPPVRRGEGVVAYGFPLAGLLSSDPKLTRGEVNGLAGIGNNRSHYQISAPVQPGNSGGPLLDLHGHVVGVVVSKLDAQRVAQRIGDIAQNVNFAVQGEAALAFLRRAGVQPALAESRGAERSAADVGEIADRSTVFIRCER
jgi:serine protease Do